ncbi:MAG TPA: hypothetical protein VM617_07690, partial [Thermoanaerobaculia bacterium]|nr:hypothetical protein [Thermoanaerobaculia bacterium]
QGQVGSVDHRLAVEEEVDVERSRRVAWAGTASRLPFEPLREGQDLPRRPFAEPDRGEVEEIRLAELRDGPGAVER